MKVQRFCLRSFLQHFLLCCVISSLLCCSFSFDSYAASTNVVADQNGDGQITADEVDLAQLATYGLVTGYGVTGSDVPGVITGSSVYTSSLDSISGVENTVVVGTVADGKVTFGEWFSNLCTNIYAEITDSTVIGYDIFRSISKNDIYIWLDSAYSEGVISDSLYTNNYNYLNDCNDFFGYVGYFTGSSCVVSFKVINDSDILLWNNGYLYLGSFSESGSFSSSKISTAQYMSVHGRSVSGSYSVSKSNSNDYFCIGLARPVFNSSADAIRFLGMQNSIYCSSAASLDCNYRNDSLNTINSYDWSVLSGLIYNHVSTAVTDANATTAEDIQSVIDSELNDLSDLIIEQEPGIDDPEEDPGTEGDQESVLGDKLDQNNALQEESNQLQQESNQLQEENNALQEESNQLQEESNALQEEENETSKGILGKITEFFGSFFQNLIDSVVGIFVPDQEDMQANFERLDQFFSDTFGFLYYPFDFLIEAVNIFLSADSGTSLTFPGFSIMGHEVWSDQSFDLTSIDVVNTIFETVRLVTGGVLAFAFINYLRSFFDKRFGGGGA